jgi:hypothetical protein
MHSEFGECLANGQASVVLRVAFFAGAMFRDLLNYEFGIVASGKSALGEGPIVFRLR